MIPGMALGLEQAGPGNTTRYRLANMQILLSTHLSQKRGAKELF